MESNEVCKSLNYIGNNVFIGEDENDGILQFIENQNGDINDRLWWKAYYERNRINLIQSFTVM